MPRRRSSHGSRAMSTSCSIISVAACSAKNLATVSVAFLPVPPMRNAISTTARCASSTPPSTNCAVVAGGSPGRAFGGLVVVTETSSRGPGRSPSSRRIGTNLSNRTDRNRYFDTVGVSVIARTVCRDLSRLGAGLTAAAIAVPDLRRRPPGARRLLRSSVRSAAGSRHRATKGEGRCGAAAPNGGRYLGVSRFDTPRPLGAPHDPGGLSERLGNSTRRRRAASVVRGSITTRSQTGHGPTLPQRSARQPRSGRPGQVGWDPEGMVVSRHRSPKGRRAHHGPPLSALVAAAGSGGAHRSIPLPSVFPTPMHAVAAVVVGGTLAAAAQQAFTTVLPAVDDGVDRGAREPRPRRRHRRRGRGDGDAPSPPSRPSPTPPP